DPAFVHAGFFGRPWLVSLVGGRSGPAPAIPLIEGLCNWRAEPIALANFDGREDSSTVLECGGATPLWMVGSLDEGQPTGRILYSHPSKAVSSHCTPKAAMLPPIHRRATAHECS